MDIAGFIFELPIYFIAMPDHSLALMQTEKGPYLCLYTDEDQAQKMRGDAGVYEIGTEESLKKLVTMVREGSIEGVCFDPAVAGSSLGSKFVIPWKAFKERTLGDSEAALPRISGTFSLSEEIMNLSLPDGREFTFRCTDDGLLIHDVSWNRHFQGTSKGLTRETIMAIQHSDIACNDDSMKNLYRFIDFAGVPPKARD